MAVEASIVRGVLGHLAGLTLSPALPVAYPNVSFTPPSSGGYLRINLFKLPASRPNIGANAFTRHEGLIQIDAIYPQGGGEPPIVDTAALIKAHFDIGTVITQDGFNIRVLSPPTVETLQRDDPWAFVPVTISYTCDEI